jgi:hypothetical protein
MARRDTSCGRDSSVFRSAIPTNKMTKLPRILGLTLILGVAACNLADNATAPSIELAGTYRLANVGGHVLPFEFPVDSFQVSADTVVSVTTWVENDFNLLTNGQVEYALVGTVRYRHSADASTGQENWTDFYKGWWTGTAVDARIRFDSVAIDGGAMTALAAPIFLNFNKNSAGALTSVYTYRHKSLGAAPPGVDHALLYNKD